MRPALVAFLLVLAGTALLAQAQPAQSPGAQSVRLPLDAPDGTWRGATLVADGAAGAAARFDGDRAHIDAGPCPVDGNAPFVLRCSLRTTHAGFCTPLMARDGDRVGLSLVLGRRPGRISFEAWSWARVRLIAERRIDDGRWHRIEVAYDPDSHTAVLLVDGELQAHGDLGPGASPGAQLRLGDNIGAHQPYPGDLDEVEIARERAHADLIARLVPVLADGERRGALAAVRERAARADTPSLAADALPAWPERRLAVRAHVSDCLGLEPRPADAPLDVRVHGALARDGVTVERISLQGFAGRRASGWLWRPTEPPRAPRPAVLCPHGHWQHGGVHPVVQARCAFFAQQGWIALTLDSEHTEAVAAGASPLSAMCWHNLRALDWLRARDDVDPARIAATGCSGGAQQTYYLMALTDDLAAAAPICMACYFREILADDSAHCGCNHLPRLAHGTDVPELCAVFAPRPAFFGSVTGDWTARFPQQGFPELQRLWQHEGRAGALRNLHREEGHDYSRPMREAVYGFLQAAFAGAAEPAAAAPLKELPFTAFDVGALRALGGPAAGERLDDAFVAAELLARRPPLADPRAVAPALPWRVEPREIEWRGEVGDGFRAGVVRGHDGVPVPFVARGSSAAPMGGDGRGSGVAQAGGVARGDGDGRSGGDGADEGTAHDAWTVLVDGRGKAIARAGDLREFGPRLAIVDPRFCGEWAPFAAAWRRNGILLGRGELYEGAHDLALVCHSLPGDGPITLVARHGAAPTARVAAFLCARIRRVETDEDRGPPDGGYLESQNRTPLAPELTRLGGLPFFTRASRR